MNRATHLGVLVSALALACATATVAAAEEGDNVRRDEAGVTGVSPFWETLKKGDNAFIAGAHDEAKTHFESAIKLEPRNPLGHTRVAQTLLAKGEFDAATERLESALGFADKVEVRAKILFLQADIRERQAKHGQAKQRWQNYDNLASSKPAAQGQAKNVYPETAQERIKQIDATKERVEAYPAVKERIAKREQELENKARGKTE